MLKASLGGGMCTWIKLVEQLMHSTDPNCNVADIWDAPGFSHELIATAREDITIRKNLLRRYRHTLVRPALIHREFLWFQASARKTIPSFGVPFQVFQSAPARIPTDLLSWDFSGTWWMWYRAWAIIRISGRWPATLFGGTELPHTLEACKVCGQRDISVFHPLQECSGTRPLLLKLQSDLQCPLNVTSCTQALVMTLFGQHVTRDSLAQCVAFVGRVVCRCLAPPEHLDELSAETGDGEEVSASRLASMHALNCLFLDEGIDEDGGEHQAI